jgi:hypothetical protein
MRLLIAALILAAAPVAAAPKYFLLLEKVEGKEGVQTDVVKKLLVDELARHPADFLAAQPDFPTDPKELGAKLAALKVKGYFVTVRILEASRQVEEPAPGKRGQLSRSVRLTLIGSTIPEQLVSFGGVGESTASAVVGKIINPKEEASLLDDALKDSISQAITNALDKLNHPPPPPTNAHKKKPKK